MSQQSAELPDENAAATEELSEQGAGLGMGEENTFEPEEEPNADVDTDPDSTE